MVAVFVTSAYEYVFMAVGHLFQSGGGMMAAGTHTMSIDFGVDACDGLCLGTKQPTGGVMIYRKLNWSWLVGGEANVPFRLFFTGLPATLSPGSPSVHSMLVVQPDRSRHELGWFTYAPKLDGRGKLGH